MEYSIFVNEILAQYPISEPEARFVRHNENITYEITDRVIHKKYLLRIHRPSTEGLFGIQHTQEGIKAEIKILQEINQQGMIQVQKPFANYSGEYITECKLDNYDQSCYATVLEWIEGETLTLKEDHLQEIAYKLGQNLAIFHSNLMHLKPSEDFVRPVYDANRIDEAIEELTYCVDADLFSFEHYEIIKQVLMKVKDQVKELDRRKDAFGLVHADFQLGNIIINKENNPCLIDLGFCGFGYFVFDLGSAATIFPSDLRKDFLLGYSSGSSFSFEDIKYIEGQVFMDTFISYVLFMRDNQRNSWIKSSALEVCDTLCKDFLEGKEIFYLL